MPGSRSPYASISRITVPSHGMCERRPIPMASRGKSTMTVLRNRRRHRHTDYRGGTQCTRHADMVRATMLVEQHSAQSFIHNLFQTHLAYLHSVD